MQVRQVIAYLEAKVNALVRLLDKDIQGNSFNERAFTRHCIIIGEALKFLREEQPSATPENIQRIKGYFQPYGLISKLFSAIRDRIIHEYVYYQYNPRQKLSELNTLIPTAHNLLPMLKSHLGTYSQDDVMCDYIGEPYQGTVKLNAYLPGDYLVLIFLEANEFINLMSTLGIQTQEDLTCQLEQREFLKEVIETYMVNIGQIFKDYESFFLPQINEKDNPNYRAELGRLDTCYNNVRKIATDIKHTRDSRAHISIKSDIQYGSTHVGNFYGQITAFSRKLTIFMDKYLLPMMDCFHAHQQISDSYFQRYVLTLEQNNPPNTTTMVNTETTLVGEAQLPDSSQIPQEESSSSDSSKKRKFAQMHEDESNIQDTPARPSFWTPIVSSMSQAAAVSEPSQADVSSSSGVPSSASSDDKDDSPPKCQ